MWIEWTWMWKVESGAVPDLTQFTYLTIYDRHIIADRPIQASTISVAHSITHHSSSLSDKRLDS